MDTNRLPKQALPYKPKGRRNIGWPRKRWREGPTSSLRIKEQETRLTLQEHDDDDDDDDDVFIWEQTATCATYNINWLVFVTKIKSVYSAVRTGSFKQSSLPFVFKGLILVKI